MNIPNKPAGTIIPLSEGSFTIDKTKIFVPFDQEKDDLQQRPIGSLLVEVQPFCIITEKDILLVDAGLGFKKNGAPQLLANLQANGIQPGQITKVLMSHLHKDHAGGVSFADRFGNYRLPFQNATYYVQKREYETAMQTGYPSYMTDDFEILDGNPQVQWLTKDEGKIDNYISYQITGGHSIYHQVFWIGTNGQTLFFGGDDAPQLNQMKSRFVAKYDYDGKKCMELRRQWWEQGAQNGWTFLFYHDISNPVVKASALV